MTVLRKEALETAIKERLEQSIKDKKEDDLRIACAIRDVLPTLIQEEAGKFFSRINAKVQATDPTLDYDDFDSNRILCKNYSGCGWRRTSWPDDCGVYFETQTVGGYMIIGIAWHLGDTTSPTEEKTLWLELSDKARRFQGAKSKSTAWWPCWRYLDPFSDLNSAEALLAFSGINNIEDALVNEILALGELITEVTAQG